MLLIDRIKEVIAQHELSSTAFADRLGVQRSSISHILSGRNKPSLDFIMKLLQAFPTTDTNWLLFGSEQKSQTTSAQPPLFPQEEEAPLSKALVAESIISKTFSEALPKSTPNKADVIVKQVVLLYSDGSCSTYTNKK